MSTLAPKCVGCETQMTIEQDPWAVVTWNRAGEGMPYRPGLAFFCPGCRWRVDMFRVNVDGEAVELEDNSPRSVFGLLGGAREAAADEDEGED